MQEHNDVNRRDGFMLKSLLFDIEVYIVSIWESVWRLYIWNCVRYFLMEIGVYLGTAEKITHAIDWTGFLAVFVVSVL